MMSRIKQEWAILVQIAKLWAFCHGQGKPNVECTFMVDNNGKVVLALIGARSGPALELHDFVIEKTGKGGLYEERVFALE